MNPNDNADNATNTEAPLTVTVSGTMSHEAATEDNWKNRRRMAYISIASNVIFILVSFFAILPWFDIDIGKYRIFVDLIQVYLVTSTSIIAAYIGFATWSYSKAGVR